MEKLVGYVTNLSSGFTFGVNPEGLCFCKFFKNSDSLEEALMKYKQKFPKNEAKTFYKELKEYGFTKANMNIVVKKSLPTIFLLQIDLSYQCNLKCLHCYLGDKTEVKNPLTEDEWRNLLFQAKKMNIPKIAILGGEPLLSSLFFPIANYASSLGFKLYTTTNGTIIQNLETAQKIKAVGFNEIDISLDGASEKTNDYLRGKGVFKKVVKAIGLLKKAGLVVKTATVIYKKNFSEIEKIFFLGKKLGVDSMYFNSLMPGGRGREILEENQLSNDKWSMVLKIVNNWNKKERSPRVFAESHLFLTLHDDSVKTGVSYDDPQCYGCKAGKRELIISPEGFAVACPLLSTEGTFYSTNIRRMSLAEIWKKDPWILKLRSVTPESLRGNCQECPKKEICIGGCHIAALFGGKTIYNQDPRCPRIDLNGTIQHEI